MRRPDGAPRSTRTSLGSEKSLVHRIRAFQWSSAANRKCADCGERGPTYICLTFQTFICQMCSGIHRGFGHKIKGISLSEWSVKELADLEAGGNDVAQAWLARWNATDFPQPDSNQADSLKEFIRVKYVEKRWWSEEQLVKARRSGPAGGAELKPVCSTKSAPLGRLSQESRAVAGVGSLLDTETTIISHASHPAPVDATAAMVMNATAAMVTDMSPPMGTTVVAPVAGDKHEAQWTADFSSPATGLLGIDFSQPSGTPKGAQGRPPTTRTGSVGCVKTSDEAAAGLLPTDLWAAKGSIQASPWSFPSCAATGKVVGGAPTAKLDSHGGLIADGLAGLDFNAVGMTQGAGLQRGQAGTRPQCVAP